MAKRLLRRAFRGNFRRVLGMLLEYVIDPDALHLNSMPEQVAKSTFERFKKSWQKNGVLVLLGDRPEKSPIFKMIKKLPQHFRKQ